MFSYLVFAVDVKHRRTHVRNVTSGPLPMWCPSLDVWMFGYFCIDALMHRCYDTTYCIARLMCVAWLSL